MLENYYKELGIYLYLIPIISAFWAMFALLAKKDKTKSQIFLAIYFCTLAIGMGFSFWYDRYESINGNEVLRSINTALTAICATSTLFYFTSLMDPKRLTIKYISSHLVIVAGFSVLLLLTQSIYENEIVISTWNEVAENILNYGILLRILAVILVIVFELYILISILRMYFRYRQFVKNTYSYDDNIDLRWINKCLFLFAFLALSDLGWIINNTIVIKILFNLSAFILICFIFFIGSRQKELPVEKDEIDTEKEIENFDDKSGENSVFHRELRTKLENYFEKKKPYLNPSLNLNDIALELMSNRTYLSQMINQEYQMNFYSFVNQYRIRDAVSLLENQDPQYTIDEVVELSGFKSKSVFYKQFKEVTGMTPLAYIKDLKESH